MRKILLIILSVTLLLCTLAGCGGGCKACNKGPEYPPVPAGETPVLMISTAKEELIVGASFNIRVTGYSDATFTSDNTSVASVDQTGLVTALSIGKATITVTANGQSKNCYVTVVEDTRIPVLKIENVENIDGKLSLPLSTSEAYPLSLNVLFSGAVVDGTFTFESTNTAVANVDSNGVITAGNTCGSAVIKVKAQYNGSFERELYAEITVIVTNVQWFFALDGETTLYPLATFNGQAYNNSVGYSATLTVGNQVVSLNQMTVSVGDNSIAEIVGNSVKAKRSGQTYLKLSYTLNNETYEKIQTITVERIIDDKTDEAPVIFNRNENVAMSKFDQITGRATEKVLAFSQKGSYKTVSIEDGKFNNVETGIREVQIYNDIFTVYANVHFVDGRWGHVGDLSIISLDEEGTQTLVLPETVGNVKSFNIFTSSGAKQEYSCAFDEVTNSLTFENSTVRNTWYSGEIMCAIDSDRGYYLGDINIVTCIFYTAEQIEEYYTGRGLYMLGADIDGATIENVNTEQIWNGKVKFDGRGHKLTNLTVKGHGIMGDLFSGYLKNIVIEVASVDLEEESSAGLLCNWMSNAVLENVYIEGEFAKVVNLCIGGNTINNTILNISGASQLFNSHHASAHTNSDTVTNTYMVNGTFFDSCKNQTIGSFEVLEDGIYFDGELLCENNLKHLVGNLYKGEIAYLEKGTPETPASTTQTIVLPEDVVAVSDFKIDNTVIDVTYDATTKTISIDTENIKNIAVGEKTISFLGVGGKTYTAYLTVADLVVRNSNDVSTKLGQTMFWANGNVTYYYNYIVIANDIVNAGSVPYSVSTHNNFGGTIDGKGNVISNASVASNLWWGLINYKFSGTIKNLALVNVSNCAGANHGIICQTVGSGKLENVYVSGTSGATNVLFETVSGTLTVKDSILNFTDNSGNYGVIASNMTNVKTENVITANDGSDFFTNNANLKFGDFEMKADGLYFGDTLVYAK